MDPLRIIILYGDPEFLSSLEKFFSARGSFRVVAACTSGRQGLSAIRRERPDLVLMGLVLPDLDGYSVLRITQRLSHPPMTVVFSEFYHPLSIKIAARYGATYFLPRPMDMDCLYHALLDLRDSHQGKTSSPEPENSLPSAAYIRRALSDSGISPRLEGSRYLAEAILMAAEVPSRLKNLTRNIYQEIADRHRVSIPSVERSIRTALRAAGRGEGQNSHPCPSNLEFIRAASRRLLEDQAESSSSEPSPEKPMR